MDELTEAEEQYQRTTKSFIDIIDRFLVSYREKIQSKERSYRRTLDEILIQTDIGVGKIYHQQNEVLLQSISDGVHKHLEELSNNIKSVALSISLLTLYNFIRISLACNSILYTYTGCPIFNNDQTYAQDFSHAPSLGRGEVS